LTYQNLRVMHWHIKRCEFFELHVKFKEFYDNVVSLMSKYISETKKHTIDA
jgi:DNA-binding ferritin-like protein